MLSRAEYAAIDWADKSLPSQCYADAVTLAAHKLFWDKIKGGEFARAAQYDREHIPFVKYAMMEVLSLFAEKRILRRSSVYKVIDPELREISKKIVSHLVRQKVLLKHESGSDGYILLAPLSDETMEELALRTWQNIC